MDMLIYKEPFHDVRLVTPGKPKTLRKNFKEFCLCKLNEDSRNSETLIKPRKNKERETGLEPVKAKCREIL